MTTIRNRHPLRPTSRFRPLYAVSGALLLLHASPLHAQDESEPPAPVPEQSENSEPERGSEPLPSLDELLGLDDARSTAEDGSADSQQATELERKLTAQDAADALHQALALMDDTARRLAEPGGTGLETQRLQEDIIRKLDTVIEAAQQNQGKGSGSSAGSQSTQSPPGKNPGKQQSGAQAMSGQGQGNAESMPAEGSAAAPGPQQLLDASAWGALPDRLRDSLRQGLSDPFSAAYRSLTEAYYRRLAEEAEGDQ